MKWKICSLKRSKWTNLCQSSQDSKGENANYWYQEINGWCNKSFYRNLKDNKKYYEQLYANGFRKLDEQIPWKMWTTHWKKNNLVSPSSIKDVNFVTKKPFHRKNKQTKKKTFRSREHQWYVPTNSGGKKKIISVVHKFFQKFEEDLFCDVHMLSPKWDKDSIRKSKQNKTKNLRATIPNENRKKNYQIESKNIYK